MLAFRVRENHIKSQLNAHSVSRSTSYDVITDQALIVESSTHLESVQIT